ncbi:MAG: membrane dipeptidase [Oscillospiraceae bacterium]|nr:membrane dipeptidase [Oscillospiraceae bacterium]
MSAKAYALFDAHCDTISALAEAETGTLLENRLQIDLTRAGRYRRYAQCFALWAAPEDMDRQGGGTVFQALLDRFLLELDRCRDRIVFCRTREDYRSAGEAGKMAAFLSVEGADLLDCDLASLARAHELGVRLINLTWNRANVLCGAHADQPERGLSEQGRAWVRAMLERKMLPDVSHLSEPGFWDVAALCEAQMSPFVASHSNARAICSHSRNLTDDQFRALIRCGGVAGLNLYTLFTGGAGLDTALDHVLHFLALGGGKHVCLGCDLDGCDSLPAPIRGVEDLYLIGDGLRRRGVGEETIQDLFYNNLERVILCSM